MRREFNIEAAYRLFYEKYSFSNSDIKQIFGITSSSTVAKIKREVIDFFAGTDINPIHSLSGRLDVVRAFEAWGIDIKDLEVRYKKLQKINDRPRNTNSETVSKEKCLKE